MDNVVLDKPVAHPSAWLGPDMARDEETWIYRLAEDDLADVARAVTRCRAQGLAVPDITRADFPLPDFGPRLQALLHEIQDGRGFVLLRGLDDPRFDRDDLA